MGRGGGKRGGTQNAKKGLVEPSGVKGERQLGRKKARSLFGVFLLSFLFSGLRQLNCYYGGGSDGAEEKRGGEVIETRSPPRAIEEEEGRRTADGGVRCPKEWFPFGWPRRGKGHFSWEEGKEGRGGKFLRRKE